MDKLNEDFLEFIRLLEGEKISYLIVGGYAVGIHGFPRYTGDIDFFVAISESNAGGLIRVFQRFGFGTVDIQKEDFLKPNYVVEIGREPRKIQVLTAIDGVSFTEAFNNHISVQYEGISLRFIGKSELLKNKIASGRPKDLIDISELKKK